MVMKLTPLNLPIPGWNKRKMTSTDFEAICEREGITVQRFRLELDALGYYTKRNGQRIIAIDSRLKGNKRLQVEFHELGHYFLHDGRKSVFSSLEGNTGKVVKRVPKTAEQEWTECEANIVACIAIAPGFFGVAELAYLGLSAAGTNWLKRSSRR